MARPHPTLTVVVVMPLAEQRGGAELSLRQLLQHGRGPGVDWVVVFLEDGPMVSALRALGVTVVVVEAGRLRQPHRLLAAVAQIARVARRERATVIVGWMTKGHVYGALAALLARRPAVWYQHGMPGQGHWLERLAGALPARGVITVSEACGRAQQAIRPRVRQRTVYPGAELDRFDPRRLASPAQARARLGLPCDGPLIGMVGRLQRWKGVHVLLDAMALVRESHPQAHCVVVGGAHDLEPGYAEEVRGRVAALGLQAHVTFAGLRSDVADWMQAMDVVVHASAGEPFGIVVIEAMALGKPVIAGSEGGPREIVTDGVDGLLVEYGDHEALATAVRTYLDDPQFANAVGEAARRRAADFSAPRYAHNAIAALGELTAGGRSLVPNRLPTSTRARGAAIIAPMAGSEPSRPDLSVCICTRDRPEDLEKAIASIRAADPPVAAIVVADDSTDERTRALVAPMDDVIYLDGPRRGLGPNRNRALAGVRTSHLAYLDDDALLHPRFVGIWRQALADTPAARREQTIISGGEVTRGDVVYANPTSFLGHQTRPLRPGEPASTIVINATVFPSHLFDRVRFDEQLVYGFDEVDIAAGARAAGYRVVEVRELLNQHFPSPVNREFYTSHTEAARLYVTWKRYASVERAPARAALYCLVAPVHLLAHGLRRDGVVGARRSARSIQQATMLAVRHLAGRRRAAAHR